MRLNYPAEPHSSGREAGFPSGSQARMVHYIPIARPLLLVLMHMPERASSDQQEHIPLAARKSFLFVNSVGLKWIQRNMEF